MVLKFLEFLYLFIPFLNFRIVSLKQPSKFSFLSHNKRHILINLSSYIEQKDESIFLLETLSHKKKKNPLNSYSFHDNLSRKLDSRNSKHKGGNREKRRREKRAEHTKPGNDTFGFGKFRSAQESFQQQTSYRWYSMVQQRESARNFYKPVDR